MPETTEVLEVVAALYGVYSNFYIQAVAENKTRNALVTLGWTEDRARNAAAWVADNQ